jgi:carbamoyl-phosphate synthase small subunit
MEPRKHAKLILADGSVFLGYSFGAPNSTNGEVVFNTGMVGYPETLTDPSYKGQIITLTYPLIGNYGVPGNERDEGLLRFFESENIQVQGLIISDYSAGYFHWNAKKALSEWLKEQHIPAIYGIDTRELTKKLRSKGTLLGKILHTHQHNIFADPNKTNLAATVSIKEPITYQKCTKTITHVTTALEKNIPILGICLGSQILALAAGANTYKLKYGHRSQNQPCMEVGTNRCYITPQNHGYAVDATTLPQDWREWFYNANDQTNEGIKHISKPFFGAQFHPEASPGPDDTEFLFDLFVRAMK